MLQQHFEENPRRSHEFMVLLQLFDSFVKLQK